MKWIILNEMDFTELVLITVLHILTSTPEG